MPWPDDDDGPRTSLLWNEWVRDASDARPLEERKPWLFSDVRCYCPTCGGVMESFESPVEGGWVVRPHNRCYTDPDSAHDWDSRRCDGGLVDPVKDRAP